MQVNELARMSEQEVSEYRKQLNGIKVGHCTHSLVVLGPH